MIPQYQIIADSIDVTARMQKYLNKVRVVDKPGVEADECEIELSDPDGTLNLPKRGVRLQVFLGYDGDLQDKGTFTIDQVAESGPPDIVTVSGCSADFQGPFKIQREESYNGKTIGDILTTIAKRYDLIPAIEDGLAGILIDHIDQTNESDPNFLTRLGKDYDAIATIKAGRLLFTPVGYDRTVSGILLPTANIQRDQTATHHFQIADREGTFTGVRAKWRDHNANQTKYATAGSGDNWKTLKRIFPNAIPAYHAAKAQWARMQRGQTTMSITVSNGDPSIHAGQPLHLGGWRPEINSVNWVTQEVSHEWTNDGASTSLSASSIS